jgi:pancreatic triacylglycerol lipase
MKSIILISTLIISSVISLPLSEEQKHRWTLVPDTNGRMHLYDLNPIELEVEPAFDALNDVIFLLFTRRNPTEGQRISFDMDTVRNSNWNSQNQARFIIHGWNGKFLKKYFS